MDMLSVGVCDRMSIDTRTVLAGGKKRNLSPPSILKTCQSHMMNQIYFPNTLLFAGLRRASKMQKSAPFTLMLRRSQHTTSFTFGRKNNSANSAGLGANSVTPFVHGMFTSTPSPSTGASVSSKVFLLPLWSSVE